MSKIDNVSRPRSRRWKISSFKTNEGLKNSSEIFRDIFLPKGGREGEWKGQQGEVCFGDETNAPFIYIFHSRRTNESSR